MHDPALGEFTFESIEVVHAALPSDFALELFQLIE